jgi:spore coat protein U-like protein
MRLLNSTLLVAAIALAGVSGSALAATATATFNVTLTIESTCTINAPTPTDVVFGTHPSTATDIIATGQLNVNCTPGTAYTVALDDGQNSAAGGVTARKMAKGTDLVPYQLYSDSGRTAIWGSTVGVGGNVVASSGNGGVQNLSVYGNVPSANFPAGAYSDVVTATITY